MATEKHGRIRSLYREVSGKSVKDLQGAISSFQGEKKVASEALKGSEGVFVAEKEALKGEFNREISKERKTRRAFFQKYGKYPDRGPANQLKDRRYKRSQDKSTLTRRIGAEDAGKYRPVFKQVKKSGHGWMRTDSHSVRKVDSSGVGQTKWERRRGAAPPGPHEPQRMKWTQGAGLPDVKVRDLPGKIADIDQKISHVQGKLPGAVQARDASRGILKGGARAVAGAAAVTGAGLLYSSGKKRRVKKKRRERRRRFEFADKRLQPGVYHGSRSLKKAPMFKHEYVMIVPKDAKALDRKTRRKLRRVGPHGTRALIAGAYNRKGRKRNRLKARLGAHEDVKAARKGGYRRVRTKGGDPNAAANLASSISRKFRERNYPGLLKNALGGAENSNTYARSLLRNIGAKRVRKHKRAPGLSSMKLFSEFSESDQPAILNRLVYQLQRSGKTKQAAYAIAISKLQKSGNLKPGSKKATRKGARRGRMTPVQRAINRGRHPERIPAKELSERFELARGMLTKSKRLLQGIINNPGGRYGAAAGYIASSPLPVPSAAVAAATGAIGKGADKVLRKSKGYDRWAKRHMDKIQNRRASKTLDKILGRKRPIRLSSRSRLTELGDRRGFLKKALGAAVSVTTGGVKVPKSIPKVKRVPASAATLARYRKGGVEQAAWEQGESIFAKAVAKYTTKGKLGPAGVEMMKHPSVMKYVKDHGDYNLFRPAQSNPGGGTRRALQDTLKAIEKNVASPSGRDFTAMVKRSTDQTIKDVGGGRMTMSGWMGSGGGPARGPRGKARRRGYLEGLKKTPHATIGARDLLPSVAKKRTPEFQERVLKKAKGIREIRKKKNRRGRINPHPIGGNPNRPIRRLDLSEFSAAELDVVMKASDIGKIFLHLNHV